MKRPLLRYDSVTAVAGHGFNMIFLENPGCAAADGLLIGIRTGVNRIRSEHGITQHRAGHTMTTPTAAP